MSPNGPKPQHPNSKEEMRRMQADAVRRVQEPGVKFDTMLVLNGPRESEKAPSFPALPENGSPTV